MKKHALTVILLGTIALLVAALAPPGGTAAQPKAAVTMSTSISSGPCDATVPVLGTYFLPPPGGVPVPVLTLYLVQPGTADVSMDTLGQSGGQASTRVNGSLEVDASLSEHQGCEAATLDSGLERPTGHLTFALTAEEPTLEPGQRIPNIIATVEYAYTTTVAQPRPTMVLSPASGPCDATVDVTGSGFQPGQGISLKLRLPGAEDNVGTLASAVTDAHGEFAVRLALGELGCRAAQIYMTPGDPTQPQLYIVADAIPPPQQIGASLAFVVYTFTTTEVSRGETARALPNTGAGPGAPRVPLAWLSAAAVLGGVGLIVVAGSLYRNRRLRS